MTYQTRRKSSPRRGPRRAPSASDLRPTAGLPTLQSMSAPIFDFSHLTPAERIELAEQLWDSLEPTRLPLAEADAVELRRRRAALEADGSLGEPWRDVLDALESNGA